MDYPDSKEVEAIRREIKESNRQAIENRNKVFRNKVFRNTIRSLLRGTNEYRNSFALVVDILRNNGDLITSLPFVELYKLPISLLKDLDYKALVLAEELRVIKLAEKKAIKTSLGLRD
jgi:hypothetical protein